MLLKNMKPFANLAKKVKVFHNNNREFRYQPCNKDSLLVQEAADDSAGCTPVGFFAVYVGEEKERFVVPTRFLGHPLFKILLEKACDEFGFEQRDRLHVPCSVSAFQELVNAVETNHGRFDMKNFFDEVVC